MRSSFGSPGDGGDESVKGVSHRLFLLHSCGSQSEGGRVIDLIAFMNSVRMSCKYVKGLASFVQDFMTDVPSRGTAVLSHR